MATTSCTVVIPTYNRKASLKQTLDALSKQTLALDRYEVVVVSDGSTDGSDGLLKIYALSGKLNLRWFTQKNSGPAAARNLGVKEAKNDVIVFVDDDVEPVPSFLECHLAHHDADPKVVVIGPMSPDPKYLSREPVWIAWEHAKLQDIYNMFKTGEYVGHEAGYMHFYSGNASVRRQWLLQAGGFNTEFTRQEDVELAERLQRICGVRFIFDFEADALHHPVRSFQSWLRIPSAYGSFDAERVQAGTLSIQRIDTLAKSRNGITQVLTDLCHAAPFLLTPITLGLCGASRVLYRLRLRSVALNMLSAVYNTHYNLAFKRDLDSSIPLARPAY